MRQILQEVLLPRERLKIGTELAKFGREMAEAGIDLKIERDQTPAGSAVDFG